MVSCFRVQITTNLMKWSLLGGKVITASIRLQPLL